LKALSFSARLSFLFVNRTRREREIFQKAVSSRDDDDFDDGDDALDEDVLLFVEIIVTIGTPLNNRAEENE
jgi:hypothetical protein